MERLCYAGVRCMGFFAMQHLNNRLRRWAVLLLTGGCRRCVDLNMAARPCTIYVSRVWTDGGSRIYTVLSFSGP